MSCYGASGVPIPCTGWTVYNSYVTDPLFAKYYTIAWTSFFAAVFLVTVPAIIRTVHAGRWRDARLSGLVGVYEDLTPGGYQQVGSLAPQTAALSSGPRRRLPKPFLFVDALVQSLTLRTLPLPRFLDLSRFSHRKASCHPSRPLLPFSLGTLFVALLIPILYLSTLLPASQLRGNPNRLGFISLATIPPLFVLSAKNGPVSYLLGRGWTGVNFLHRWMGRVVVLLTFCHGLLWTIQWQASGQMVEFLSGSKERRGIGAFSCLLLIALSSSRPVRRFSYSVFFVLHYVGVLGFLVFVNRHTVYARGWATWAVVGIYVVDIAGRVMSFRVRYVEVEHLDGGMVRIGLRNLRGGWRAGQHVSIRLFFTPPSRSIFSSFRPFEAHPFSISNAPSSVGVLNSSQSDRGIELYARSHGTGSWTGDLYATAQLAALVAQSSGQPKKLHMLALVEGPYGGLGPFVSFDQENVLLVAGGSGMSFVLGVLDEIVGTRIRAGQGGKIQVVWAVRDRAHIRWFSDSLRLLLEAVTPYPNLKLTLRVYLTCDPTLTTENSNSSSASIDSVATASGLALPHTQLILARPVFTAIIRDTVGAALAPCGNCYPVCHCGEENDDGVCANDEEECCGSGPASGRYLLEEKEKDADEVAELPELPSQGKMSCCDGGNVLDDEKDEISFAPPVASCCSPVNAVSGEVLKAAACGGGCCADTGPGCCSGGVEGAAEKKETGPLKLRTGGLGIAVCGPSEMVGELRNAIAGVPLSRQVRIGGIDLHSESFCV